MRHTKQSVETREVAPVTDAEGHAEAEANPIVLASGSPRRREILTRARVAHEVMPPDVDERMRPGEKPHALAVRLAVEKAREVAARVGESPGRWVLAADTIVVVDDDVLGKPVDASDARRMLARLTGQRHRVITGVAWVHTADPRDWSMAVSAEVDMRAASAAEIADYVATGEPLDKAGSYGIQGEGGRRFVAAVEGSESNVMGLPLEETLALMARARSEFEAGTGPSDAPARPRADAP